jgi:hypothetical protein
MPRFDRHFTRLEAQKRVPWVRGVLERIHQVVDSVNASTSASESPSAGGDWAIDPRERLSPERRALRLSIDEKRELLQGLVNAILGEGIVIQDVRRGLIDFPCWKDGREVLLCYELDDGERIRFWHELDAGFAGRQSLENWCDDAEEAP